MNKNTECRAQLLENSEKIFKKLLLFSAKHSTAYWKKGLLLRKTYFLQNRAVGRSTSFQKAVEYFRYQLLSPALYKWLSCQWLPASKTHFLQHSRGNHLEHHAWFLLWVLHMLCSTHWAGSLWVPWTWPWTC